MIIPKKTTLGISSLSIAAILVIAPLASIGMMETDASAATTIFREDIRGTTVSSSVSIREGDIRTFVNAFAFDTKSEGLQSCVHISIDDFSTGESLTDFVGCSSDVQLTIDKFNSATFSSTITAVDGVTGEEKTVTVDADMTAIEEPTPSKFRLTTKSPNFRSTFSIHATGAEASGSLDISGDFTLSFDDTRGTISKVKIGTMEVQKL